MTTHTLTATLHVTHGKFALGDLTLRTATGASTAPGGVVVTTSGPIEVTIPDGDSLEIRLQSSTVAVEASASYESQASQRWTPVGGAVVSPPYPAPGELGLTLRPPDGATSGATTTTATIRINKPGKPDDFLQANFPPA
jgi:hypothetical protein